MKRLTYTMMAFLLLMVLASCRQSQADRYQRYLEEKNDTTFEFIEQPADSVVEAEAEASAEGGEGTRHQHECRRLRDEESHDRKIMDHSL